MRTARATICFDDGRETALTLGASILEKYRARGTFYPIKKAKFIPRGLAAGSLAMGFPKGRGRISPL